MKDDLNAFTKDKGTDVIMKLANFIYITKSAPVVVKLKIVEACIKASITYSCGSWGTAQLINWNLYSAKP